jgi:hypothetical protein
MPKLEIVLQSSEAEAKSLATEVARELSDIGSTETRALPATRGMDAVEFVVSVAIPALQTAASILTIADAIMRARARLERAGRPVTSILLYRDVRIDLCKATRDSLVGILRPLK